MFKIYKNKKVIITGHTGFKGAWLTFWMGILGAKVLGISKDIPSNPSLHKILNKNKIINKFFNISNFKMLNKTIKNFKPDFIFHLAAQSLVKKSIQNPLETFNSNIIGTANILECLKNMKKKCAAIIITSDKCYLNIEKQKGYRETDTLGGKDPYSASKAAAELLIFSYKNTFLEEKENINFCSVRAGNVIGGGDWSNDRLVPDLIKAWSKNKVIEIRNVNSTRPWQHILDAVGAYIYLGSIIYKNNKFNGSPFNFGPSSNKNYKTKDVIRNLSKKLEKKIKMKVSKKKFKESALLKLNCQKAKRELGWSSILNFQESTLLTAQWYKEYYFKRKNIVSFTKKQILNYSKKFKNKINNKYTI